MKKILASSLFILFLSGCSPHPGSGIWQASETNTLGITTITLSFDGKGKFIGKDTWHCFWGGVKKQTAAIKCTPASNTDDEQEFLLVIEENNQATLSQNNQQIGIFQRQAGDPKIEL